MATGFKFSDFVFDSKRHELRRGDFEIGLGERSIGVLKVLLENSGRVVSRHELMDAVWPDVAVTDDSLAKAVSDLRAALEDDAVHPSYVRTVHRQGYLFIAPVNPLDDDRSPLAVDGRRPSSRISSLLLVVAAAGIIIVSVLVTQHFTANTASQAESSEQDLAEWRLRALGPLPFTASAIKPAFAKSGNLLALVSPDPDTGMHSLFLLRPNSGEPLQLTHGIEVRGPTPEFTADDSHLIVTVYRSDPALGRVPDVWLIPVPAGEPILLMKNASAASTSPDGRSLVYAAVTPAGTSIRVRHEDGRELEIAPRGFWPRWSPDGRLIAFTTSDPEGGNGTLRVVRPDGSGHVELTTTPSQLYGLCWTPDGSRVIFASNVSGPTMLWSVDVHDGAQRPVTRGPGICTSPTMAADGRSLVFDFSHRRWFLYLASKLGEAPQRVLMEPGLHAAALSPDGTRIAVALGAEAQSPAISILDLPAGERRTISGLAASGVAWMPGGRNLLVTAPAPDGVNRWIWTVPVAGGLPEPVMVGHERWSAPAASPDGLMIAAVRQSTNGFELVVRNLENGKGHVLVEAPVITAPKWSPDGQKLAWSGKWRPGEVGSGGVWVCDVEGGSPRRLTLEGAWPVWESDGDHLLFLRFLEHRGIWRVSMAGEHAELVQQLEDDVSEYLMEGLDIARDGGVLLLFLSQYTGELYALEPPAA